jgi:hypothetical protein
MSYLYSLVAFRLLKKKMAKRDTGIEADSECEEFRARPMQRVLVKTPVWI